MGRASQEQLETAPFSGFNPSTFWPFRRRLQSLQVSDNYADVRRLMRAECPRCPGVYGMLDRRGHLIYVGMSTVLPKRLVTYFQDGAKDRKESRIASHTDRLVWEALGHGLAAQLRELELIRHHQPRFNVKGRRARRPLGYVFISREEAPRLRVARQVPRGVRYTWGPLSITWQIREAVESTNRIFKLRDCRATTPMQFGDQSSLFALELRAECLRGETGSCLGPCAGLCTRGEYTAQLRAIRAFLDGRDRSAIVRLEEELTTAVAKQQFERAAAARDKLVRVNYLADRFAVLRERPLPEQFIYPARVGQRAVWYVVAASRVVAALPVPTRGDMAARNLDRLERIFDACEVERLSSDRLATQILVGWFRTRPEDLQATMMPGEAIEICRRLVA